MRSRPVEEKTKTILSWAVKNEMGDSVAGIIAMRMLNTPGLTSGMVNPGEDPGLSTVKVGELLKEVRSIKGKDICLDDIHNGLSVIFNTGVVLEGNSYCSCLLSLALPARKGLKKNRDIQYCLSPHMEEAVSKHKIVAFRYHFENYQISGLRF